MGSNPLNSSFKFIKDHISFVRVIGIYIAQEGSRGFPEGYRQSDSAEERGKTKQINQLGPM